MNTIPDILANATRPVVLFSGGMDSLLLLHFARTVQRDIPCIWWNTGKNQEYVKRIILEWDLSVLSYNPVMKYMVSENGKTSEVREFAWGDSTFPIVTDVIEGDDCSLLEYPKTLRMFHDFDVALVGWKSSDKHWLLNGAPFPPADGVNLGNTKFYAPLRDWTSDEVWQAVKALDLPYDKKVYPDGTDEIALCGRCYLSDGASCYCPLQKKEIKVESINPGVRGFRERFGISENP